MIVYYTRKPHNTTGVQVSNTAMAIFEGISFLLGAVCSAFSGYAGMWVSVRANIRVASACKRCYNDSIRIAFIGGFFAAVINIALAILGIGILFLMCYFYLTYNFPVNRVFDEFEKIPILLVGFGFGASFVAMFA